MALTTAGREWVVDKMQGNAPLSNAVMGWIGWGTSGAAEVVGDTALTAEVIDTARAVAVQTQPTATTDRAVGTLTATTTRTIQEVGRFNQLASGAASGTHIMIQRHIFTAIPLLTGDAIQFTLDVTT